MRTHRALRVLAIAILVVLLTRLFGWPAPALAGALVAVIAWLPSARATGAFARPAAITAAATMLGWGALLVWALLGERGGATIAMLGGLVGAHGGRAAATAALFAGLTLALGALLAWAAATLVAGLLRVAPASAPGRVTLSETSGRLRAP